MLSHTNTEYNLATKFRLVIISNKNNETWIAIIFFAKGNQNNLKIKRSQQARKMFMEISDKIEKGE